MGDPLYAPGQAHSVVRTVTAKDVERFAEVSGDTNPMHLDDAFAATTRFGRRIAHGMLGASYISALIGTRFPGPGTIYLSQSLRFTAPVFLGDVLAVTATVKAYRADKDILTLVTTVVNQRAETVILGEAVCLVRDVAAGLDVPARVAGAATATRGPAEEGVLSRNGRCS